MVAPSSSGTSPLLRLRLQRRLKVALHAGHVLISAPPGYGKTTLLRSLLAERAQTHYLTLSPADADLAYLRSRLSSLLQPDTTILIDDLHLVGDEPEILDWLQEMLHAAGPRMALSGRTIPPSLLTTAETAAIVSLFS